MPAKPHGLIRAAIYGDAAKRELQAQYAASEPYRHLVIPDLLDSDLLQAAKEELQQLVEAKFKETDIYKVEAYRAEVTDPKDAGVSRVLHTTCSLQVYQTGDLANLDGLSAEETGKLQNLNRLRDALRSLEFRQLIAELTAAGPLSGEQIDLSVNLHGHTGHLLCHDDVIGTRKV